MSLKKNENTVLNECDVTPEKEDFQRWENFGDVNFVENGGTMVRPHYSCDEIKEYPELATTFDVFCVEADFEYAAFATLLTVDISDEWIWKDRDGLLSYIGVETLRNLPNEGIFSDIIWAKEIVSYFPQENFSPVYYHQGSMYDRRLVTTEQLRKWMTELGMEEYLDIPAISQKDNFLNPAIFERCHKDFWTRIQFSYLFGPDPSQKSITNKKIVAAQSMFAEGLIAFRPIHFCFACEFGKRMEDEPRKCKNCPLDLPLDEKGWKNCLLPESPYYKLGKLQGYSDADDQINEIVSLCKEIRDLKVI